MLTDLYPRCCIEASRRAEIVREFAPGGMASRVSHADLESFRAQRARASKAPGAAGDLSPALTLAGELALVHVQGVLTRGVGMFQMLFGGYSYGEITAAVRQARADPTVKRIVLLVDSPGGSVAGLAEASDAVFQARRTKRVVAQVHGMAASAAYRIASQADEIHAGRADEVGSIGTLWVHYDMSEMAAKEGVEAVVTSTGWMKGAGAEGAPITPEQRAEFQRVVDADQAMFHAEVVRGRRATDAKVRSWSTGQVWHAPDALAMGLIDSIATPEQTIGRLRADLRAEARAKNQTAAASFGLRVALTDAPDAPDAQDIADSVPGA